jgi:hypothetical protein
LPQLPIFNTIGIINKYLLPLVRMLDFLDKVSHLFFCLENFGYPHFVSLQKLYKQYETWHGKAKSESAPYIPAGLIRPAVILDVEAGSAAGHNQLDILRARPGDQQANAKSQQDVGYGFHCQSSY